MRLVRGLLRGAILRFALVFCVCTAAQSAFALTQPAHQDVTVRACADGARWSRPSV